MVIEKCNTTTLLQEVATRLALRTGNEPTISTDSAYGFIMSEENIKIAESCLEDLAKNLTNISEEKPNDLSILAAVTHFILEQSSCCAPYVEDQDEDWSCNFTYNSEVRAYEYRNHVLEFSILIEKNVDSTEKYYYMCFSFPEGKHIYHVEEIPINCIPTFDARKKDSDRNSIQCLYVTIGNVFDSFCLKFIETGKFHSREFSSFGIKPVFSESIRCSEGESSKKRKKDMHRPALPYDMKKFKRKMPIFYTRLIELYKKCNPEPTASARLLALIHEILSYFCNCKIATKKDEWPGGPTYDGSTITVWFPNSSITESVHYHVLNVSLLKNNKEFFCCFRFVDDHRNKIIKKLDEALVPAFKPTEAEKDRERIDILYGWLSMIIEKFINKVITGSYSSRSMSFVSVESSGETTPDDS